MGPFADERVKPLLVMTLMFCADTNANLTDTMLDALKCDEDSLVFSKLVVTVVNLGLFDRATKRKRFTGSVGKSWARTGLLMTKRSRWRSFAMTSMRILR